MRKESIMWKYIAQEPDVLGTLLEEGNIGRFAAGVGEKLEAIYFVAHGSSYNASATVSDFIARNGGVRVYVCTPANFQYNMYTILREERKRVLVAAISQTGTSSGVIEALRTANKLGFRTLGITDAADSPVEREADYVLKLGCGTEDSNAKTKGYSATLVLLMRLALSLGREKGILDEAFEKAVLAELRGQIEQLPRITEQIRAWCERADYGSRMRELYVLGYGMNYGTAMEGQLKLMETMCIPTMFNDIGEFSHGMHRAITRESSVLLLRTYHPLQELTEETFRYLQTVTGQVLMLDAAGDFPESENRILIPAWPLTQSLLLMTLAVQVLSVSAPEQIGKDPNRDAHNDFTEVVHTRV